MNHSRREFLKTSGIAGLGLATAGMLKSSSGSSPDGQLGLPGILEQVERTHAGAFNMCGYAAPKIETVRIGFIGIGGRGGGAVQRLMHVDGIEIKALGDIRKDRVDAALNKLAGGRHHPATYTDGPEAWKAMCGSDDIDLIYICTPWRLHTPMAAYAMEQGKHAAVEVPAACTVDECWQLVETSERTRKHCRMLENTCYDFFELLTLNMARHGVFGEIIHGDGAYLHHLGMFNHEKDAQWGTKEYAERNGDLYPTHGLGPICSVMNINRGDRLVHLASVSSDDFTLGKRAGKLAEKDPFFQVYADKKFSGNMNTSIIRTARGRTIMLQSDGSTPRVYSRIYHLHGTNAVAALFPHPPKISLGDPNRWDLDRWLTDDEYKNLQEKFTPAIVQKLDPLAKKAERELGGHSGMDFRSDWSLLNCLWNGLPLDQDVYDAATWSVISPLTEWSVANRSNSIEVPDFTHGRWAKNKPVNTFLNSA